MNLTVTKSTSGQDTVLHAAGSIDAASRSRLAEAADAALSDGATSIVVDLGEVSFMDSTGVGTLIEIANQLDDIEGSFGIRNPSRPVSRVLEVSGLSQQWEQGPAA